MACHDPGPNNGIQFEIKTGFGLNSNSIPADIKMAVSELVAHVWKSWWSKRNVNSTAYFDDHCSIRIINLKIANLLRRYNSIFIRTADGQGGFTESWSDFAECGQKFSKLLQWREFSVSMSWIKWTHKITIRWLDGVISEMNQLKPIVSDSRGSSNNGQRWFMILDCVENVGSWSRISQKALEDYLEVSIMQQRSWNKSEIWQPKRPLFCFMRRQLKLYLQMMVELLKLEQSKASRDCFKTKYSTAYGYKNYGNQLNLITKRALVRSGFPI